MECVKLDAESEAVRALIIDIKEGVREFCTLEGRNMTQRAARWARREHPKAGDQKTKHDQF